MKNKICKVLVGLLFMISFVDVKADENRVFIESEKNTISMNGQIELKIGFDDKAGSLIVEREMDPPYTIIKGKKHDYKMKDIYLLYDNRIFEIDLSKIKAENENYVFNNYYIEENNDDTIIRFSFDIKNLEDENKDEKLYDGKMDDILLSNIIVKQKNNSHMSFGQYNIIYDQLAYYQKVNPELMNQFAINTIKEDINNTPLENTNNNIENNNIDNNNNNNNNIVNYNSINIIISVLFSIIVILLIIVIVILLKYNKLNKQINNKDYNN